MGDRTDNWEELVQSQENRLYRAALAILGSRQEAEDAVQDTFLAFWEKAPEGLRMIFLTGRIMSSSMPALCMAFDMAVTRAMTSMMPNSSPLEAMMALFRI